MSFSAHYTSKTDLIWWNLLYNRCECKTAVKVYPAKETLQLLDVLRVWAIFDLGSVIGRRGHSHCQNPVSKNLKRRYCKNTFSKLMVRPLAAKAVKKAPDGGGVFACPENWHVSRPYMQTHLPNHPWCNPSFFEMFGRRWTAQKGWANTQTSQMAL